MSQNETQENLKEKKIFFYLLFYIFFILYKRLIFGLLYSIKDFFLFAFLIFCYTVQKTNILAQDMEVTTVIANLDPDLMFHPA